jgi:hypothetical protein
MPGHENVKTEAEAIKLFSSFWMTVGALIASGNEPDTKEPTKEQMASTTATFMGLVFGDEMQVESFSCPLDQAKGKVCWAEAGIPISLKAAIRMEGVAEFMTLGGANIAASFKRD